MDIDLFISADTVILKVECQKDCLIDGVAYYHVQSESTP